MSMTVMSDQLYMMSLIDTFPGYNIILGLKDIHALGFDPPTQNVMV